MRLRAAADRDQATIRRIVRAAGINPTSLQWQRFIVAEERGEIVGVGQVKPHRDGTRELASIAVVPERQGRGLGSEIINALIAREHGEVLHL
ncbi:MAG TPA: GNAT family N-acetyltransferase, partial [Candidatus Dormibacteraeota bacterium]|nr:GNAT family N-acetyltransferase [Candidatus Dormibacteraeota bacterium]